MTDPKAAKHPMKGGREPTIAPKNVLKLEIYFIGVYIKLQPTHMDPATTAVPGYGRCMQSAHDAAAKPPEIKNPVVHLTFPVAKGLFSVQVINQSCFDSTV